MDDYDDHDDDDDHDDAGADADGAVDDEDDHKVDDFDDHDDDDDHGDTGADTDGKQISDANQICPPPFCFHEHKSSLGGSLNAKNPYSKI